MLELISAFEEASGVKINTEVCGRRKGDVSASFASCDKIEKELGWKAELSIKDMCEWISRQKTKQGTCSGTCGGKNQGAAWDWLIGITFSSQNSFSNMLDTTKSFFDRETLLLERCEMVFY